jgi:3-phosphoshikimate 1-carboxyvinyltransferase
VNLTITPALLHGAVTPPPSKSQAHRLLLCAALAGGDSIIENLPQSQDIDATRRCVAALQAGGTGLPRLDCGESGSTLRFLIPLALVLRGGGVFTGRGRLMERPQGPYFTIFHEKGIHYEQTPEALTVQGELTPGAYRLPGNVSSQFVTGLLYALPLLEGDSEIVLTTQLESRGYVDMTVDALERFGVRVRRTGDGFFVPGRQRYRPAEAAVEPDWSQAAFWLAARLLGSDVTVENMAETSHQGDRAIADYARLLSRGGNVVIDVSQCPDLVPPLAAMAAARQGTTLLENAGRLRLKESDRLDTVTEALTALGADIQEGAETLTITGRPSLAGGEAVRCHNDHRIAMMAAVAATRCEKPVTLLGAECVSKSYPNFWEDYRMLGGKFHEQPGP